MALHIHGVQPFWIVNAPLRIADSDDGAAQFLQKLGPDGAHIAEPLHDYPRSLDGHAQVLESIASGEHHSAAGGLPPAQAAADLDGLAGDHSRHRIAFGHAVGVHDPGHSLGGGVDIGGRDVRLRADEHGDLAGVAPGQAFQFPLRHHLGIADHAAFSAAVGNPHHCALPGHPHGQGAYFVQSHIRMVADAPLGRPASQTMLHAVASEHLDAAVIHLHREIDTQLPLGKPQLGLDARFQVEILGRNVELPLRYLIGVFTNRVFLHF